MKFPHARLLVFSRAPVPGRVKTRLVPLLGPRGAAALQARFTRERLALACAANLCPVELWCSPGCDTDFFRYCARRFAISLHAQPSGDLGRRMHLALSDALGRGGSAVLIGTDCPGLTEADLEEAFSALERGTSVVLGPATDGGYYLIGLRRSLPTLFCAMAWGSGRVYAETVARLDRQEIPYHSLRRRDDVDTPEDYRRLCAQRAG